MHTGKKSERPAHPRATANPLSAFFFIWVWKIFKRGMQKELELDDLFVPLKEHRSDRLGDKFESSWKKDLANKKQPSLLRTTVRHFFWEYAAYCIPVVLSELVFRILQPIFLGQLIQYFEPESDMTRETAYLSAFGLIGCSAVFIFVRQSNMMYLMHLGMKIRVGVCSLIYRKSLRLTMTSLGETTVGQVVNLLSNDVGRFDLCIISTHFLLLAPIQAVIVTYFMWDAMGISVIIGVLVTLSFIPLQGFLGKKIAALRLRCALRTDERVRLMNEIISAIQVIKFYTWEMLFAKLVARARLNEIGAIRLVSYLRAIMVSFELVNNRLTLFVTILSYVLMGNIMTAEKAFVVSSYFKILSLSMTSFVPQAIYLGAETLVSVKRIEKFLLYKELERVEQTTLQEHLPQQNALTENSHTVAPEVETLKSILSQPVVVVTDATAKWTPESKENNTLANVSLKASSAELLAIIGPVGSGKTSLLHALMKELPLTSGSIYVRGRISYVSQEPWLFASSVRNNILFGEEYDRIRYRQVVNVCALVRDLELLPYGDKTVVGERGISLSGGQRARINLARAVYKQADIYILDDPLSAVDAHVGKHLFENCIRGYLRNKTCILVTHQLQFLSHADHIVILKKGSVEAHGTYSQLQESGLDFAKLLGDQEGDESEDEGTPDEKREGLQQEVPNPKRSRGTSVASSSSSLELTWAQETSQVEVQETVKKGRITLSTYSSYLFASGKYFLVVLMLLCNVIAAVLSSGTDYWLSFWTNVESLRAIEEVDDNTTRNGIVEESSNSTYSTLIASDSLMSRELCSYIFAILTVASIVFLSAKIFVFFYLCMKSSVNLHNRMFNSIIRLPMRFFNLNSSGQILNRFSKDTGIVDEQLPLVLMDCLTILFVLLGIITLVAIVNYWILLPTLLVFILFYVFRSVYVQTSRSVKRLEGVARSPIFGHLSASLQGLTTIRAFRAEKILQEEFDSHQDLHSSAYYLFVASNRAFGLWLDIVCLFYIACVTLSFLVLEQGALSGSVGLAISQSLALTGMFQWGMRQSAELENQMTSVERVLEYGSLEDEGQLESAPDKKPAKEWPSRGRITFKNVFLSYASEEPPVLKNLSFTIDPSEKVGIVGRTGAGKSSLISALFRLTNVDGAILIDDINTKSIGLHDLRNKISIIPQEPILFSGSLRNNLDPFDEYPDSALWSALEEVELKEAVDELPAGLSHRMTEGGSNFSLGQRQLVCLARAIIKNNRVLVMDEATANVDPRTDAFIQETVRRKFADCTVLTIAHRLLTVMDSDKILVMDAGNAVEFDHPYTLMQNKNGFLWSMVQETGKYMAESLLKMAEKNYYASKHEKTS